VLAPDVSAFVLAALPAAPARLLEIGAGSGELAAALREGGYEVAAIDPASESPTVRNVALHELDEPPASFDAAVAVISFHHIEPLDESCRRLGDLVRSGGTLVVDEFDIEQFNEPAASWWLGQRPVAGEDEPAGPRELVADLRDHLHPLGRICDALDEWFLLGVPVRGAYLYRWDLPPGMSDTEEQLIAAGRLPATGARMLGTRR
jgi:SAM-dependent methyltransferase